MQKDISEAAPLQGEGEDSRKPEKKKSTAELNAVCQALTELARSEEFKAVKPHGVSATHGTVIFENNVGRIVEIQFYYDSDAWKPTAKPVQVVYHQFSREEGVAMPQPVLSCLIEFAYQNEVPVFQQGEYVVSLGEESKSAARNSRVFSLASRIPGTTQRTDAHKLAGLGRDLLNEYAMAVENGVPIFKLGGLFSAGKEGRLKEALRYLDDPEYRKYVDTEL